MKTILLTVFVLAFATVSFASNEVEQQDPYGNYYEFDEENLVEAASDTPTTFYRARYGSLCSAVIQYCKMEVYVNQPVGSQYTRPTTCTIIPGLAITTSISAITEYGSMAGLPSCGYGWWYHPKK